MRLTKGNTTIGRFGIAGSSTMRGPRSTGFPVDQGHGDKAVVGARGSLNTASLRPFAMGARREAPRSGWVRLLSSTPVPGQTAAIMRSKLGQLAVRRRERGGASVRQAVPSHMARRRARGLSNQNPAHTNRCRSKVDITHNNDYYGIEFIAMVDIYY